VWVAELAAATTSCGLAAHPPHQIDHVNGILESRAILRPRAVLLRDQHVGWPVGPLAFQRIVDRGVSSVEPDHQQGPGTLRGLQHRLRVRRLVAIGFSRKTGIRRLRSVVAISAWVSLGVRTKRSLPQFSSSD